MSYYLILDEHGQPMRKVKTKHEADTLIKTYTCYNGPYRDWETDRKSVV